jgi:hypothetical protein
MHHENTPSRRRLLRWLVAFCCVVFTAITIVRVSARSKLDTGKERFTGHREGHVPLRIASDRHSSNGTAQKLSTSAAPSALDSLSSDTSVIEIQQNITATETTKVAPPSFPPPPPIESGIKPIRGWGRCQNPSCTSLENCSTPGHAACCADLLQELLEASSTFMSLQNISYYVFWGTLLGSFRNKTIISYTSDVDLVVERGYLSVLEGMEKWNQRYYFWTESHDIGRMCFQDTTSPGSKLWGNTFADVPVYVDVYVPLHVSDYRGLRTVFPVVANCIFQSELIYNAIDNARFETGQVGSVDVPVPVESEKLLLQIYGESWAKPDNLGGHGKAIHCPQDNFNEFVKLVREGRKNPNRQISASELREETVLAEM